MLDNVSAYQTARMSRDARFDGRFFVAVKTTGIFCRPICPATLPKEQNVEYFPLAQQAMEAGYRPCLRCRPDSAPHSHAWKGVDTTVDRAITLLKAHPDLSLTEISDKLGITDRYLRQLFQQRVGMSPKHFQLYEQLLFAKQLLHASAMTIEQVAQASGFSSSRRLQDNMRKHIGLTPKQVRRKPKAQSTRLTFSLSFRPPYHWPMVRDFLAVRAVDSIERIEEDSYSRTYSLGQYNGWFEARYEQEKRAFDVTLEINEVTGLRKVLTNIRRILDLDADPTLIEQSLKDAGLPDNLICHGLRLPGVWDPFESGCRAILGQQISVKAAINLLSGLVKHLGKPVAHGMGFPSASDVANSDLAFLGMPARRKACLRAFAEYVAKQNSVDELEGWLSVKGIGPWTVKYSRMRGLSHPDIWLDTDLVVKKQLQHHKVNADSAAPWRSYLTFQLWRLAE